MKINFTPLLFVLGFIAAHSQITTSGNANMFVNEKTLVYSTGDITINSDNSKIINWGNMRIKDGTYKNLSTNGETGILELGYDQTLDGSGNVISVKYGQLIINSGIEATGKIVMQKNIDGYSTYAYFGSPFQNYKFEDFAKDVTGTGYFSPTCNTSKFKEGDNKSGKSYCSNWKDVPIFVWNNKQYRNDPVDGQRQILNDQNQPIQNNNGVFQPGLFYNIRKSKYLKGGITPLDGKVSLKGIPYVASSSSISILFPHREFKIGENAKDVYNVYFYTYLTDPFVPTIEGNFEKTTKNVDIEANNFSNDMLQLINPFTSNLNLREATNNYAKIDGIGSYGKVTTPAQIRGRYKSNMKAVRIVTTPGTSVPVGSLDLEIIPPMTNFFIKAKETGVSLDLYNSKNQTFDYSSYKFPDGVVIPTGRISSYSTDNIYQISLQLFNKSKDVVYNDTYVASGSGFETATLHKNEVYSVNSDEDRTSIYTLPEGKTGGVDPALADIKLYINVINSNSDKVAIPVGIDINKEDGSTFVITSELAENGKLLAKGMKSFDDPNAGFYFHDKKLGKSVLIDSNFKYEFTQVESTKDRFEIFWSKSKSNGGIGDEIVGGTEDAQALNGLTIIYKSDNDDYKVRFNKNWKKADVSVFSILGQLISSEKNINTENDYLLPIKNISSSMFVVKITNEKGETVTKKIVK